MWLSRTMKKPNSSAPIAATTGDTGSARSTGHPAFLTSSAAVYAPSAKYAACPNETMPPKPINRLKAVANSPMIAISVRSCRKNGGSASGASARAASRTASARREGIA